MSASISKFDKLVRAALTRNSGKSTRTFFSLIKETKIFSLSRLESKGSESLT